MPAFLVPHEELEFRVSRSSGPGGQHVNKTSSRVQVSWNIASTRALNDDERSRLRKRLSSRLDSEENLTVTVSETRSQLRNREIGETRLGEIVSLALRIPKKRKATRPTRAVKQARLDLKKKHSDKKKARRSDLFD